MSEQRYLTVSMYVDSNPMLHTPQTKELVEGKFRFVVPCDDGPLSEEDTNTMGVPVVCLVLSKTPNGNPKFEMEGENRWCNAHGVYIGCSDSRFEDMYGCGTIPLFMPSTERIIPNY